ncbi:MAG: plasmid pRiA4b ORF-3 family protein [Treponema sp.]|nr:plasmid pRiA4b ORF-3 family protein [Treponema sp.]
MTISQEEALFDFLDNVTVAFKLEELASFVRMIEPMQNMRLTAELETHLKFRNIAFPLDEERWLSRRGFFEKIPFVISPTRLELLNGILVPGHRCVPFANPCLLPQEYSFFWQDSPVPFTTTEGPPEEFYPFYCIFGEEYAPQYVARDNSENEKAFNSDPFDDPPEVSIKTLDMRNIYREASFVPGDRFVVRTLDWKEGIFSLEKAGRDEWQKADLDAWLEAAEAGFESSFSKLGPASCTEEQIAYAYWYGDSRMRELPAYALEDYLFDKTNRIETAAYGIESRFWYAGREIPDCKELRNCSMRQDLSPVELVLHELKIPVSEFLIQSYIRDSLYREDGNADLIMERLIPASVELENQDRSILRDYIENVMDEFREFYNPFTDKKIGFIRLRAGELHTAVIDLCSRLSRGDIDPSWLPRHTFIILSQIQGHTTNVMEDLDSDESFPDNELGIIDSSLDSMVETYEDIKELIDEALGSFRRNKLMVIRPGSNSETITERLLQISIGGIDVWRRIIVNDNCSLGELHKIIQTIFGWRSSQAFKFSTETLPKDEAESGENPPFSKNLDLDNSICELESAGIIELLYEYGTKWIVRITILSRYQTPGNRPIRCVAGAGAGPPEFIAGPLKFRRVLSALESKNDVERLGARQELGTDFVPEEFDLEECNRNLNTVFFPKRGGG